ncbi:MAG: c-type cytochrome [Rhizobacter sp.]|nr:c-type cytochrome [Ferruginibacter sp.]
MMKRMPVIIFFTIVLIAALTISFDEPGRKIKTRADLGKQLFSEKMLSKDSSVSCASCHKPDFAFADTVAFSTGIYGKLTSRNTPSVLNMKNRPYFFWDGRAKTLEEQALIPIANPDEMGLAITVAVERLNRSERYRKLFKKVFGQLPNAQNLGAAFAAFEKTLETDKSKFDDWANGKGELSQQEENGRQLFISNRAKCFDCHSTEDFTNDEFKNIGLYNGISQKDEGRFLITKEQKDLGRFKTPGLRNVAVTGPYMHDGRFKTLEQVVQYYNNPYMFVEDPLNMDTLLLQPLQLSNQDNADLVAFLKTLTDKQFVGRKDQ